MILKYRLKANAHRPAIVVLQNYSDLSLIDCFPGTVKPSLYEYFGECNRRFDEMAPQSSLAELKARPQTITIKTRLIAHNSIDPNTVENSPL